MKVTILKEADKLANKGLLGALEARVLKKMVSQESPVLMAAFRVRINHTKIIIINNEAREA